MKIEPVSSVPVSCIAVDSASHLYLAGETYVPTHNTSWGPLWLYREITRKGPGDYLMAAPSYPLIDKAAGPEVEKLFGRLLQLGKMKSGPWQFTFSQGAEKRLWGDKQMVPTRILFGHADEPESLEAMGAKAAWLDECGQQKFKVGSWEAIQRRTAIDEGRMLLTSTPYSVSSWMKTICDKGLRNDPDVDVVNFSSLMNPAFPKEEYERAKRNMPLWRFRMFYDGIFERPAGVIYDCFDTTKHVIEPIRIPDNWPRYLGMDFGGVNTAGVFLAAELLDGKETGRLYLYREYHQGGRTAKEHAEALLKGEVQVPMTVGGSHSEDQWRDEFGAGGLPIREPRIKDVEVGINRVWGTINADNLYIFNTCEDTIYELSNYSRETDDAGGVMEKIAEKEKAHRCDALRYIISYIRGAPIDVHELLDKIIASRTKPPEGDPALGLPAGDKGGVKWYPSLEEYWAYRIKDGQQQHVWGSKERDEAIFAAFAVDAVELTEQDLEKVPAPRQVAIQNEMRANGMLPPVMVNVARARRKAEIKSE